MENIHIERIVEMDNALISPINALLRQLSSRDIALTESSLRHIVEDGACHLFIIYCGQEIAGMLTLGIYSSPTGRKAWIEDVVVDQKHRGKGLGRQLVQHAINYTRKLAPITLMLTSNPARTEANALYRSEGFEQRCTNVYKMEL